MIKHRTLTLAALALLLPALMPVIANAQTVPNFARPRTANQTPVPKVVFIGDYFTYNWSNAFAQNPNWINQGVPAPPYYYDGSNGDSSAGILGRFQADVVSLHPQIVHIMMGAIDAANNDDAVYRGTSPNFLSNLSAMVQEAKAAGIGVVLGLEPKLIASPQLNSVIVSYGAINNIPVINYADVLCGCIDSASGNGSPSLLTTNSGGFPLEVPSTAEYAAMTQLAEPIINTLNLKLEGGYLQNIQQANPNEVGVPTPNVNTVNTGAVVQFTPYGYYNQPGVYPFLNTNYAGATGTWTSSNPLVMYVTQTGLTYALSGGTAIITYTSPSGVQFSEWIMYVHQPA